MLKKLRKILFIFFSIILSGLSAQEITESILNKTTAVANQPKLLVDDGESMLMSYAQANLIISDRFFGLRKRLNSRRWRGYQENIRVTEPKFFEIAGFSQEAKNAARFQTIRQSVFWSGTGMALLGILIGVTKTDYDNKRVPPLSIGLLAIGISLDVLWFLAPPNYYTLGRALDAVHQYNQRE